ncbi:MAG TPA: bifunctional 3-phenylpropionate/cinnamic acid dioxygenase ferredoxin subunit [Candidatus Binataceae bacterium]|nr:bifunctional 3-phenylpropionate/cinnamic acid dioxygenase ferredoxin subunit [Candidatus Binataceae bacterium]
MAWMKVCQKNQVADQSGIKIKRANPIAIFRVGDKFFATDDTCTHAKFSLSEGYVEEEEVVCALHEARFCLRTGRVLSPPATVALRTYPVKVEGDDVLVELDN